MKRVIGLIFILCSFAIILSGCFGERLVIADTPINAAMLMKHAADNHDFESYKMLFAEGLREKVARDTFNELQKISTAGSSYNTFVLVEFKDGGSALVWLTPQKMQDGKNLQSAKVILTDAWK